MLQSICQKIWKTQQWLQDWKRSLFIPIPKKGNAIECPNYHISKLKNKNHIIISTDAEKAFDTIQQPFMINSSLESGKKGNIYKHAANIILYAGKLKAFPLRSGMRQGCHCHQFNSSFESLAMAIRDEKEVKGIQTGKHVKLPFLADYMVLYRGISKKNARKLLEFISLLSKFAGYKIYTQEFLAFLCTINERTENEIKDIVIFTIALKIIQCLEINLPKETKHFYSEKHKVFMKEIRYHTSR